MLCAACHVLLFLTPAEGRAFGLQEITCNLYRLKCFQTHLRAISALKHMRALRVTADALVHASPQKARVKHGETVSSISRAVAAAHRMDMQDQHLTISQSLQS